VPELGSHSFHQYKPTCREHHYRTEVGVPYGIEGRHFLLATAEGVYGTSRRFPDPEQRRRAEALGLQGVVMNCRRVTVSMVA